MSSFLAVESELGVAVVVDVEAASQVLEEPRAVGFDAVVFTGLFSADFLATGVDAFGVADVVLAAFGVSVFATFGVAAFAADVIDGESSTAGVSGVASSGFRFVPRLVCLDGVVAVAEATFASSGSMMESVMSAVEKILITWRYSQRPNSEHIPISDRP